jgi:hypothetical protein
MMVDEDGEVYAEFPVAGSAYLPVDGRHAIGGYGQLVIEQSIRLPICGYKFMEVAGLPPYDRLKVHVVTEAVAQHVAALSDRDDVFFPDGGVLLDGRGEGFRMLGQFHPFGRRDGGGAATCL